MAGSWRPNVCKSCWRCGAGAEPERGPRMCIDCLHFFQSVFSGGHWSSAGSCLHPDNYELEDGGFMSCSTRTRPRTTTGNSTCEHFEERKQRE
jgi:hypothetical protein